ncbi:MAG: hypothetical protein KJ726_10170 [Verrucomicrobia bacterium]|nr:hypothetical protein [Verrucomicrobiota bacterium]MBU1910401.1 hypothetical protein [Verrucomicrobiota bacterium]
MSKVTVLCVAFAKDEALDALRELGVLHVVPIRPPAGELLDDARARLLHVRRALEMLDPKAPGSPSGQSAEEVVEGIWKIIHRRKEDEEMLESLRHEQQRIAPFGSFDPAALVQLKEQGICVKLYQVLRGHEPLIPEGAVKITLGEDQASSYFAVVSRGDFQVEAPEVRLPDMSLKEIEQNIAWSEARLAESERRLQEYSNDYAVVSRIMDRAEETVEYLEARQGMTTSEPVAWLQGFCPVEQVAVVRAAAARYGWGLVEVEPDPDDRVPTLLRPSRWARPIKALYDMFGILPGYDEVDISPVFLVFFSIFFGMLIGDAGYGLIFLVAALAARKKMPSALFGLLVITSVATIVWGVLTGTWFSIAALPAPLAKLRLNWLKDNTNLMELCFFIGAVHLTIAHGWKAFRIRRTAQALAHLGWIGSTWGMFFVARHLILNRGLPSFMLAVLAVGVVAIVLCMTPPRKFKEEWFNHAMLPLNLISNFVDIVSYVRLFAVGSATLAVGAAFNDMLGGLMKGPISGLIAAVILFGGHALNIGMAILGVMVHGVRLNTLEFSQHMDIAWKGYAYRPFTRRLAETATAHKGAAPPAASA